MATSRTGTTSYLQWRRKVLARDKSAGITQCPLCGCTLDHITSRTPDSADPDHITPTPTEDETLSTTAEPYAATAINHAAIDQTPHDNAASPPHPSARRGTPPPHPSQFAPSA